MYLVSHCTQPSGFTENGADVALPLWSLLSGGRLTVIWEVFWQHPELGTSRGDGKRQKDLGGLKLEEAIGPLRVRIQGIRERHGSTVTGGWALDPACASTKIGMWEEGQVWGSAVGHAEWTQAHPSGHS